MSTNADTIYRSIYHGEMGDEARAALNALLAENEQLRAALEGAISVAQWMSGSESFSPGGEAHDGWLRQREVLFAAMKVLEAVRG